MRELQEEAAKMKQTELVQLIQDAGMMILANPYSGTFLVGLEIRTAFNRHVESDWLEYRTPELAMASRIAVQRRITMVKSQILQKAKERTP